jgi:hypothetical protein
VTVFALSIATLQVGVRTPVQAPPQAAAAEPEAGVAVRVTSVPGGKPAVQGPTVHVIPVGLEVTVPLPVPVGITVRTVVVAATVPNVAVTPVAALTVVTVQVLPLHAPLHPAKLDPEAGVAVSVTGVPGL